MSNVAKSYQIGYSSSLQKIMADLGLGQQNKNQYE